LPNWNGLDSRAFAYERKKNGKQERREGKRANTDSNYFTSVKCPMANHAYNLILSDKAVTVCKGPMKTLGNIRPE
jgi:hypothetical protein